MPSVSKRASRTASNSNSATCVISIDRDTKTLLRADQLSGKTVGQVELQSRPLAIAYNVQSGHVAVGTGDGTFIVDATALEEIATLPTSFTNTAAYSSDGLWLATAGSDLFVRIFDVSSYKQVTMMKGHTGLIWASAFTPDSLKLATGSRDNSTIVWSVPTMGVIAKLDQQNDITAVLFLSNTCVITGSADASICAWETKGGKGVLTKKIEAHTRVVNTLTLSHDSKTFASGSDDRTIRLFDVHSLACIKKIKMTSTVRRLCFSNDVLLVGQSAERLVSIDIQSSKTIAKYAHHDSISGIVVQSKCVF